MSEDKLRVAMAIYAALHGGRVASRAFFTTPATGGEDYLRAAEAASNTIRAVRSERDNEPQSVTVSVTEPTTDDIRLRAWNRFMLDQAGS